MVSDDTRRWLCDFRCVFRTARRPDQPAGTRPISLRRVAADEGRIAQCHDCGQSGPVSTGQREPQLRRRRRDSPQHGRAHLTQDPRNRRGQPLSADEYAVALFDDDVEQAEAVAERLRAAIAEPHAVGGMDVIVTASLGLAEGVQGASADELLRRADEAMRLAKQLGSNQVRRDRDLVAKPENGLPPLLVETMLRQALQNGELEIHYQPKIHTRSMQVVGAEALCRWTHPELGHIPPQAFIPVAESSDLILPIDEYVLRSVCRQGATWMKQGYRVRISVNISGRQFMQDGFPKLVRECLAQTGMDPQLDRTGDHRAHRDVRRGARRPRAAGAEEDRRSDCVGRLWRGVLLAQLPDPISRAHAKDRPNLHGRHSERRQPDPHHRGDHLARQVAEFERGGGRCRNIPTI